MIGQVVEIAEDGRHLSITRGFMVVRAGEEELGRVPLDDIAAVVANAHGLTYSNNLVVKLAERNVPLVVCGPNHMPRALLWPVETHHTQNARMRWQIDAGRPLRKRLWQSVVRAKIANQGAALAAVGRAGGAFDAIARRVRSGDPENLEAQAAQRYWPQLMGAEFRRDPDLPGTNGMLNYGYAILRSAVARSVMAAGLHPTIGIHHENRGNPMCLVDDLMEPFRPVVDVAVFRLLGEGEPGTTPDVTPEVKRRLAAILTLDMATRAGTTPLATCAHRLALSVARAFETGDATIDLPLSPMPLEFGSTAGAERRPRS